MQETDWFILAVLAAVFNGIQKFCYKATADEKKNSIAVLFTQSALTSILAGMMVITSKSRSNSPGELTASLGWLAAFGIIGAVGFVTVAAARLSALKAVPASIVFTIFRSNIILVLVICHLLPEPFEETISKTQYFGIFFILVSVWLLTMRMEDGVDRVRWRKGIFLSLVAVFISPVLYVSQKYAVASCNIDTHLLILAINLGVMAICAAIITGQHRWTEIKGCLLHGASIGLTAYIGFALFLEAIRLGSLPLVASINSTSFLIVIILFHFCYHEKLTWLQISSIILTVVGMVLIKLF
jgi:drug/metabolite transporter (DMT)-like permease